MGQCFAYTGRLRTLSQDFGQQTCGFTRLLSSSSSSSPRRVSLGTFAVAIAHWPRPELFPSSIFVRIFESTSTIQSSLQPCTYSEKRHNQLYGQIRRNEALLRSLRSVTHLKHPRRSAFTDRCNSPCQTPAKSADSASIYDFCSGWCLCCHIERATWR